MHTVPAGEQFGPAPQKFGSNWGSTHLALHFTRLPGHESWQVPLTHELPAAQSAPDGGAARSGSAMRLVGEGINALAAAIDESVLARQGADTRAAYFTRVAECSGRDGAVCARTTVSEIGLGIDALAAAIDETALARQRADTRAAYLTRVAEYSGRDGAVGACAAVSEVGVGINALAAAIDEPRLARQRASPRSIANFAGITHFPGGMLCSLFLHRSEPGLSWDRRTCRNS